jgi:hypothetical protein
MEMASIEYPYRFCCLLGARAPKLLIWSFNIYPPELKAFTAETAEESMVGNDTGPWGYVPFHLTFSCTSIEGQAFSSEKLTSKCLVTHVSLDASNLAPTRKVDPKIVVKIRTLDNHLICRLMEK